ncbi:autotransporter-associated beta strand repeat-containing protein, partial [Brucella sp. TWI432]
MLFAIPVNAADRCEAGSFYCEVSRASASATIVTDTWNGTTDTDWFTGSNWTSGNVPTAGRAIISGTTAATAPIIEGKTATSDYLTIGSGEGTTLKTGSLTIKNGGQLKLNGDGDNNTYSYVSGDNPALTVTGKSSKLTSDNATLVIGSDTDPLTGNGTINVLDSAAVDLAGLSGGSDSSGSSKPSNVNVNDATLILNNLNFGYGNITSNIDVTNHGVLVVTKSGKILNTSVTVSGSGSQISFMGGVFEQISTDQNATINVLEGAIFKINNTEHDYIVGGTTTVDGKESEFKNLSNLHKIIFGNSGNSSNSVLTVSNYGTFHTEAPLQLGNPAGRKISTSNGTLNVGAAADAQATAPGIVKATNGIIMTAGATINFNHTDTSYEFGSAMRDADPQFTGVINQISGTTILTADSSFTGAVNITGGVLQFGANSKAGSLASNNISTGIDGAQKGTLAFSRSDVYTYEGIISGTGNVKSVGSGTTVLFKDNKYSGGTVFSSGTLSVNSENKLGDASGKLTFDGGILQITGTYMNTTSRNIEWDAGGGGFDIDETPNTFTLNQNLGAGGALTKLGDGTLVLSGTNLYKGGTNLNAGTLSVSSDSNLGDASGALRFDGGTLLVTADMTSARAVTLTSAGGTVSVGDTKTVTLTHFIGNAGLAKGAFTKAGNGTLITTASNSYTGGTTVSGGILQLGDGTTDGSIMGDIALDGGNLVVDNTGATPLSGAITGTGSVTQNGAG